MFSNLSFRRAVIACLILAGLLAPLRTVFACQLMEGRKQYACCCHGREDKCQHGGCPHDQSGGKAGCCDVFHEIAADASASLGGYAFQVLLLEAPRPPPVSALLGEPAAVQTVVPNFRSSPPVWFAGTHTYLSTQRFRI